MPEEQRKILFEGFWSTSDFNVQNAYICGCIHVLKVSRRYGSTTPSSSRRCNTRIYYIKNGEISTRVCKTAFLRIHGVSNGRVDRALKAQASRGGCLHTDQRGRHTPGNKTDDAVIATVKVHVQSFPHYQSHYSRKDNPHKLYLSPHLSITKMYNLYKEKCVEMAVNPVSEWIYRRTFNESFNLSFGRYV